MAPCPFEQLQGDLHVVGFSQHGPPTFGNARRPGGAKIMHKKNHKRTCVVEKGFPSPNQAVNYFLTGCDLNRLSKATSHPRMFQWRSCVFNSGLSLDEIVLSLNQGAARPSYG
jgi:hypothetical protein